MDMNTFLKNTSLDDSESKMIRKQIIYLTRNYYEKIHKTKEINSEYMA